MFNRQPFNRGKFNRSAQSGRNRVLMGGSIELNLYTSAITRVAQAFNGDIAINLVVTGDNNHAASFNGEAFFVIDAGGEKNRAKSFSGEISINLSTNGDMIRGRTFAGNIPIALTVTGLGFNNFITDHIHLSGLRFRSGDELIIDTDNMTVTQNGQGIMRFVDRDSEFFLINPGINEVVFRSTGTNNQADMRILWKDAWL